MNTADRILKLLSSHGTLYTRQLAAKLELAPDTISRVCRCLRDEGCIVSIEGMHGLTKKGREILESGAIPCRKYVKQASLRQRAWNAMKMRDSFRIEDLLEMVCDGTEGNAAGNLYQYCEALFKAGILKKTQRTRAYILPKGQGPLCPAYNRPGKYVVDRNSGILHRLEAAK